MSLPAWLSPLHDADGMRAIDAWAIQEQGVPSLELMEAAGTALAEAAGEIAGSGPVRVVCGKGNNSGDGLVAARLLHAAGHEVDVLLLWPADELSGDAAVNLERLGLPARQVDTRELGAALAGSGAIVDAIFGTGFSGAPRAPADAAIEAINASDSPAVAADIASGVNASTGAVEGAAVESRVTVSFHAAKLGHRIAPGKSSTGELRIADIGIPPGAPQTASAGVITEAVLELAPRRGPGSTKFSSGQVLVVGASRGLTGAVCLAASAAIRAGAGYATVAVPADLEPILEAKLTEVMSRGCPGAPGRLGPEAEPVILQASERAASVALGPGFGRAEDSQELVRSLAAAIEAPLVLDADGLNAFAGQPEALSARTAATVLTPHAGELGRLLGLESSAVDAQRLQSATDGARRSGAVLVLKGDDTIVCDPRGERVAINAVSAPGLATAGTGDVLTGTIAALLGRGMVPFDAACAGVLAHARAGRVAAERVGAESVIASDVVDSLPQGLALP
jgi:NAD(P)H-hydrate epimerase